MISTAQPGPADHATGPATRGTASIAGAWYLLTFVTSIPTLALYRPLRDHANFVLGVGSATSVRWGALLEVALAVSCAGTAVTLFPVLTRHSARAALGFLAARLVEASLVLVGVASLLAVLALRRDATTAAADASSLVTAGRTLVAVYDQTFLLSQSLMPVVSALCLGSVLLRTGLVPRVIPLIGLVGAPLLLASDVAVLFGGLGQRSAVAGLAALPIALWELLLGLWLVVRGFHPVAAGSPAGQRPGDLGGAVPGAPQHPRHQGQHEQGQEQHER